MSSANGRYFAYAQFLCMCMLPITVLHAQTQAEHGCLRADHDQPSLAANFAQRTPVPYSTQQTSCWISADQITESNWRALDVRQGSVISSGHLPGTTAISLAELQDKTYLRQQPLLLIGTGVDLHPITQACVQMRSQGFENVRVLAGGARNWRRKSATDIVSPQDLWVGGGQSVWRIATVGLSQAQIAALPQAPTLQLPADASAQSLQQAIAQSSAKKPLTSTEQWLVLAADAATTQAHMAKAQAAAPATTSTPIAWVSGGWDAYYTYLTQQQSMAAHAGRPLPRSCGS